MTEVILPMKILVVEDAMPAALAIKLVLKKQGFEVEHAKDGQEAVDMACSGDYGFIFMDIGIPVFDGLEATKKIRQQGIETPIVALTANLSEYGQDALKEAGLNGGYQKPLSVDLFAEIAREYDLN